MGDMRFAFGKTIEVIREIRALPFPISVARLQLPARFVRLESLSGLTSDLVLAIAATESLPSFASWELLEVRQLPIHASLENQVREELARCLALLTSFLPFARARSDWIFERAQRLPEVSQAKTNLILSSLDSGLPLDQELRRFAIAELRSAWSDFKEATKDWTTAYRGFRSLGRVNLGIGYWPAEGAVDWLRAVRFQGTAIPLWHLIPERLEQEPYFLNRTFRLAQTIMFRCPKLMLEVARRLRLLSRAILEGDPSLIPIRWRRMP